MDKVLFWIWFLKILNDLLKLWFIVVFNCIFGNNLLKVVFDFKVIEFLIIVILLRVFVFFVVSVCVWLVFVLVCCNEFCNNFVLKLFIFGVVNIVIIVIRVSIFLILNNYFL